MRKISKLEHAMKVVALCLPPVVVSLMGLATLPRKRGAAAVAGKRSAPVRPAAHGPGTG
jgi:hypothetical protein